MGTNYAVSGWIHPLEDGRLQLIGQRCRACGTQAFPRTAGCKKCSSSDLEEVLLGPEATLYSVTTDRTGATAGNHKMVGQAQFAEGAYVQGYVVGEIKKPPLIGSRIELVAYDLEPFDGSGTVTTYGFRPKDQNHA